MNPFNPAEADGREWLKGNLHTHTTHSDGAIPLDRRIAEYAEAGYDFLSITDHHVITRVSGHDYGSIVLIPGVELHPKNPHGGPTYHLLVHNVTEDIEAREMAPQDVIDHARSQGGIVWLAHPYWNDVMIDRDVLPLTGLAGIEVYNAGCARDGRGDSSVHWDQWMKRSGDPVPAIATDDAHSRPRDGEDRFQGYTWVLARDRSPAAVLEALTSGMSYASCSPLIHSLTAERITGEDAGPRPIAITVESSPVVRISGICDAFGGDFPPGPATTEFDSAVVRVPECRYVRLELADAMGRKAWTNPMALEQLLA